MTQSVLLWHGESHEWARRWGSIPRKSRVAAYLSVYDMYLEGGRLAAAAEAGWLRGWMDDTVGIDELRRERDRIARDLEAAAEGQTVDLRNEAEAEFFVRAIADALTTPGLSLDPVEPVRLLIEDFIDWELDNRLPRSCWLSDPPGTLVTIDAYAALSWTARRGRALIRRAEQSLEQAEASRRQVPANHRPSAPVSSDDLAAAHDTLLLDEDVSTSTDRQKGRALMHAAILDRQLGRDGESHVQAAKALLPEEVTPSIDQWWRATPRP